jgi:hypothetical protein
LAADRRLDIIVAACASVFMFGVYLDGWAHKNVPDLIETFFTPYHMVFYGGFTLTAGVILATGARQLGRGKRLTQSLPAGYAPAFSGLAGLLLGFLVIPPALPVVDTDVA